VTEYAALALYADSEHNGGRLRSAAEHLGLTVVDLPRDPAGPCPSPRPGLAWRAPLGLVAALAARGVRIRLTAAGPEWFAALPEAALGRRVAVVPAGALAPPDVPSRELPSRELPSPEVPFAVALVKLADAKLDGFPAARTRDTAHAAQLVRAAALPGASRLLVADRWLDCDSEYRVFCVGSQPVTWSPYLVEGEAWGPQLHLHRASFHEQAAAFAGEVLAALDPAQVPPACVLDVARLPSGRLVLLEANTVWGAGLYGCDPVAVLRAVLAANDPAEERWVWTPDPVLVQRAHAHASRPAGGPS
jgi:hypothetical protein